MSIHEKACLVKLTISQWTATRLDRKKSDELCQANGTTREWLRANKTLLPKSAIDPISKLASEARNYHYGVTLPWDDMGARILATALYTDYVEQINRYTERFGELVAALCRDYPRLKDEARTNLNGAFREEDYPADLSDRYGISVKVTPIPQGSDLRIAVGDAELQRLRASIESNVQQQLAESMKDLWRRLRDVVAAAAERLSDSKAVFRDSLIGNIRELVDVLPKLNILSDKDLNDMAAQIKKDLAQYEPNVLRRSRTARRTAANKAQDALKKLDWYMKK